MSGTKERESGMPRRLSVLIAVVCVCGAAPLLVAGLTPGALDDPPAWWRLVLVGLVILLGDLTVLHMRFGKDHISFTWSEASVIVGLVLVPWPWLTLVGAPCVAVAHLVRRRALIKVAFNALSMAAGATLARIVVTTLQPEPWPVDVESVRAWLALTAGAATYFLWNTVTVSMAVAFSQGVPLSLVNKRGGLMQASALAGNTVAALVLCTVDWTSHGAVTVPAFVFMLYLCYRGYLRATEDRDLWQQLDETSREISRLDEFEVADAALRRAEQLFSPEAAELTLASADGYRTYSRVGDTTTVAHHEHLTVSVLAGAGERDGQVVIPLEGLEAVEGFFVLRFSGGIRLTQREQQVLRTFLRTVGVSLQNVRVYEIARDQARQSAHEASHDSLTGLANRSLLQHRMRDALASSRGSAKLCALLLIDLDHFKEVNDTLGHSAGDQLLTQIAQRLDAATRTGDTVARLGGDEFAVLLLNLPEADVAETIARNLLAVIAQPVHFQDLRLTVEASIGVSVYPDDAGDIEELLQRADVAMYQAKTSRALVQRYRSDKDDSSVSRLSLATELRAAIDRDELVPFYQPKVDLRSGGIVGMEALVRWRHPTRGLLGPHEFINVAEHSGLVHAFTLRVLDSALEQCAAWRADGRAIPVSVNLSARNLLDKDLPGAVSALLDKHRLPGDSLMVEITETVMMSELDVVEQTLSELCSLGVRLSVDDFGTGYSSLAFLQRVSVNEIKIDKSFVQNMRASDNDAAIVRATIDLGHGLGLHVVAEGVEDADILNMLVVLDCDTVQGYHLGRPLGPVETRFLLAADAGARAALPLQRPATEDSAAALTPRLSR